MKRILLAGLALMLSVGLLLPSAVSADSSINEKLGVPIVVYGANLSESERNSVGESLNVDDEAEVEEIEVTGQDLVTYISDGDPNARMYSSAKIMRKDAGKGLEISIVTPDNITQVTPDMYATAMLTAGIEDASVQVAAPKKVSGHSALVGIYKAYEVSGETLDKDRTDVANDELDVATQLTGNGVDKDQVAELLTDLKQQISEKKPATKEEVEQIIKEQLDKHKIELSDADRQLLIDLMDRIRNLDIDFSKLSQQLDGMASKIKEKLGEIDPSFWEKVKEFLRGIVDSAKSIFQ